MQKTIYLIAFFLLTQNLFAQIPKLDWKATFGGIDLDEIVSVKYAPTGEIICVGNFQDIADLDPGIATANFTSNGNSDIFICKLNPLGNLIWAKQLGGADWDRVENVVIDPTGNILLAGQFGDWMDFDPGTGTHLIQSNGSVDAFVLKLDPNGTFQWVKTWGGQLADIANGIQLDPNGNIGITGSLMDTVDINPGPGINSYISNGISDFFILKLDAMGNYLWSAAMGGPEQDIGNFIMADPAGNWLITGLFSDTVDFDPGIGVTNISFLGGTDSFVLKLDNNGNFVWVKSLSGPILEHHWAHAVDAQGNIYITGLFNGTADFDPGPGSLNISSTGYDNGFVQKLDAAGNLIWAKIFGGNFSHYGKSIQVDAHQNVYFTGAFGGSSDFDPGPGNYFLTAAGNNDIFVSKLDSLGNLIWARAIGGATHDQGYSIDLNTNGNILVGGRFMETPDFDPSGSINNGTSAGSFDGFVLQLFECNPDNIIDYINACEPYTWINGVTYTTSNYTDTIFRTNHLGCDSIITLNLTLPTVNTQVTQAGGILTSQSAGGIYQWVDCNNGYAPIPGANSSTYIPTQPGSYAVIVTNNFCSDTSLCNTVVEISIDPAFTIPALKVYPNPSTGKFVIEWGNTLINGQLRVYNSLGQIVEEMNLFHTESAELNLSLPTGQYWLDIVDDRSSRRTAKVVIY